MVLLRRRSTRQGEVVRAFIFIIYILLPPRRAGPPLQWRGTLAEPILGINEHRFSPIGGARRQPEGGSGSPPAEEYPSGGGG